MTGWAKAWWILAAAWEVLVLAAALSSTAPAMATLAGLAMLLIVASAILAFLHLSAALADE